jgi:AsmA family protein
VLRASPHGGAPPPDAAAETSSRRRTWPTVLAWVGGILGGVIAAILLFLLFADWNMLRGPISRYASERLHREVIIAGDLDVHPWSWTPSATVNGLRIADPAWAGRGPMTQIDRLTVQIRLLPLLRGHVDLMQVRADRADVRLKRDAQGRATWDFSDGKKKEEPLRLPPIRRFIISDGKLRLEDQRRGLIFNGTVSASEHLGAANRGFQLAGDGALNRAPFHLRVTGGALLNIDRTRPYPFDADIRAGATHVIARGDVPRPFDLGDLRMNVTATGQDLEDLYDLTGVTLPNTPPYRLQARFIRNDLVYRFDGLRGRVGDSDLAGRLQVDASGKRPKLDAQLTSRSLDFDDLAAVFGAAPKVGPGETASPQQAAVAREMIAEQRLFPDATLKVDRLRAMDADVTYRAAAIRDAPLPLRSGAVKLNLDRGLLTAHDLAVELPRGRIAGVVRLNARGAVPVTDLDLRLSGARLEQLVPAMDGGTPLAGALVARAKLRGTGDSVHRAASTADGQAVVVVPGGEIRRAFAELLGVNVVKGLGLLLSKDQEKTDIRCAVADFRAVNGVLTADNIVFDTGPVLGTGRAMVDLRAERIDLRVKGHPKKAQLIRVIAPVTVKGPLTAPKFGVETDKAVAQGGIAVALGALATPLAAILPFLDPGLAKDAACGSLVAGAAGKGAPVKTASR